MRKTKPSQQQGNYDKRVTGENELLEEIWQTREKISEECDHDVEKLAVMLLEVEAQAGARVAHLPIVRKNKPSSPESQTNSKD